eukprot:5116433-Pleurochrysis_carterae.AAC.1
MSARSLCVIPHELTPFSAACADVCRCLGRGRRQCSVSRRRRRREGGPNGRARCAARSSTPAASDARLLRARAHVVSARCGASFKHNTASAPRRAVVLCHPFGAIPFTMLHFWGGQRRRLVRRVAGTPRAATPLFERSQGAHEASRVSTPRRLMRRAVRAGVVVGEA